MNIIRKMWSGADQCYHGGAINSDPLPVENVVITPIEIGHDYMDVIQEPGAITFAMRGSDDGPDWWDNFMQTPWGGLEGFVDVYEKFKEPVCEVIKANLNKEIYFTAHSRGAPIVQWLAFYVGVHLKPCSCITFACPPHLIKNVRDNFNMAPVNFTNVINPGDIVATSLALRAFGLKRPGKDSYLPKRWSDWLPLKRSAQHTRHKYWKRIKKRFTL